MDDGQDQGGGAAPVVLMTREMFLAPALKKRRFKEVMIEGLPAPIRIRSLDDKEYSRLQVEPMKPNGQLDRNAAMIFNAKLITLCCVDHEGNRLFKDGDVAAMREMDAAIVDKLAAACREHVGIIEEEEVKK